METRIDQLRDEVANGFTHVHDFGRNRANVLAKVSPPFGSENCTGQMTTHAVVFYDKVAYLSAAHMECIEGQRKLFLSGEDAVITHPTHDLAIIVGDGNCPNHPALNITNFTLPVLGDMEWATSHVFGWVTLPQSTTTPAAMLRCLTISTGGGSLSGGRSRSTWSLLPSTKDSPEDL